MNNIEETQEMITKLQLQLRDISINYWTDHVFNTWQWWFNIAILILPVILWWKLVDKKKLMEIIVYGSMVSALAVYFDSIGETSVLWEYPYLICPIDYILVDVDYAILPVLYMLVYQYFPSWNGFIVVNTVLSAIYSFLVEPLFVQLGLYEILGWKFIYSFPIYIVIAIACKWITVFFMKKQVSSLE